MNYFKVTFSNDDSLETGFNGTLEEAQKYYVDNTFNLGHIEDLMVKGVKVEVLE
jgi:hypothetical protein